MNGQTNGLTRRALLLSGSALVALPSLGAPAPRFSVQGSQFMLDGVPLQIRSGEMHYPRVPRAAWRDRFRKARALGLNTITTYAFWFLHEPQPGRWDFSGNLDLRAYIQMAAEEGLYVILRPGPYVCAEVDFGGFPGWLLGTPGLRVRSLDPRFTAASQRYLQRIAGQVADLQSSRGGPILMLQLENEYGSYGKDRDYLAAMQEQMRAAGFDAPLFTSDGGLEALFDRGTRPEVPAVVNFGGGVKDAQESFDGLAAWRPRGPRMAGEYWAGWFDHWGEAHHLQPPEQAAETVDWMMGQGHSFNLYMFHGGTSFGWMPGANYSAKQPYQPDTTSYDYDAVLDEAGRITPKYRAVRECIARHLAACGETSLPSPVDAATAPQAVAPFALLRVSSLLDALPTLSPTPATTRLMRPMEHFGQTHGLVLYRKRFEQPRRGSLAIDEVRDHATVLVNGRVVGTLERRLGQRALPIDIPAGATLDLLIENLGRINFGAKLVDEVKGISSAVHIDEEDIHDWQVHTLALDALDGLKPAVQQASGPAFHRGQLMQTSAPADTFLDTRGWGRGLAWINGRMLGRFWAIGPQQTLYVPASWMKPGANELLVLSDRVPAGPARMQGLGDPVYETPTA